jgi:uncharacterized protein YrzB (UPF0473 family)
MEDNMKNGSGDEREHGVENKTAHDENCNCGHDADDDVEMITLACSDGVEREFGVIGSFEADGKEYVALCPLEIDINESDESVNGSIEKEEKGEGKIEGEIKGKDEEEVEVDLLFCGISQSGENTVISPIEDDEEYQMVSDMFFKLYDDDDYEGFDLFDDDDPDDYDEYYDDDDDDNDDELA